ncbi:MAG TPA: hypothetical protein VIN06_01700 [Devosia sp.]
MIPMPKLSKAPNGDYFSRKAIPADVREEYGAAYGVKREALFRWPKGASAGEATKAWHEWLAEVGGRIDRLRAARTGAPHALSTRELRALSERWYDWFLHLHEGDPGTAEQWQRVSDQMRDVWESGFSGLGDPDAEDGESVSASHRRRIRAKLTELAMVPTFLAAEGVSLNAEAENELLDRLLPREFGSALMRLMRLAEGATEPDPNAVRQAPPVRPDAGRRLAGWSSWDAFAAWVKEAQPRPSTVNRWRGVFKNLDTFLKGKDVSLVSGEDAVAWKDALVAGDAGARTIRDIWLTAARTVFNYCKGQKKIASNPFEGVTVAGSRTTQTKGEFREEDALAILKATLVPRSPRISPHLRAAVRWVPWLCAYTGSRPGEMTQLRKEDLEEHRDGFWMAHIRSEAGTVKGQIDRTVVLHADLIEQGFLDFVANAGPGPLFYGASRAEPKVLDPLNPPRPPYVIARQKLADWVRNDVGIKDTGVSPNHAWRHTFKRRAARAKIEQRIRDAFCGHSDGRVGAIYETPTVEDLAEAIKTFPRYEIDAA